MTTADRLKEKSMLPNINDLLFYQTQKFVLLSDALDILKGSYSKEEVIELLKRCEEALLSAAYNLDYSVYEDLDPSTIESTSSATTCLIAVREIRNFLNAPSPKLKEE